MVNTFVAFLAGGIILLAALLLIFGISYEVSEIPVEVPKEHKEVVNISEALLIGPENIDVSRLYIENFSISYMKEEKDYNVVSKRLYSGLLFGSNKLKYDLSGQDIESLGIRFDVTKTNSYAPMMVRVNGVTIIEKIFNMGSYEIQIPGDIIEDEMSIEMLALSSSWKIWAPTVYELEDIQFTVKSFSLQSNEFKLSVTEEMIDEFKEGKIELQLEENVGKMIIEMNNKEIYSDYITDVKMIKFDKNDINAGDNSLGLSADLNSKFSGKARIVIFYEAKVENRILQAFDVSEDQYNALGTGRVSFDIVNVEKAGGFTLKLKYNETALLSEYGTAEVRSYSYEFGKDNVAVGTNILTIDSLDDGVFHIDNLKISLPK